MSREVLAQFEAEADRRFEQQLVPHPNLYVARWYLLTASEDSQRIWLTGTGGPDDLVVEYLLDKMKFSLRSCLALAGSQAKDRTAMPMPAKVVGAVYVRARDLVLSGCEYAVVAQIAGAVHARSADIEVSGDVYRVEVNERLIDARYTALELMRQSAAREPDVPMSALVWVWMRHADRRPPVLRAIADSIGIKARRVIYEYDPDLSFALSQHVPQRPLLIPEGWTFPWGGRHETMLLLNAFGLRVLYHICAVHFGSVERGLRGGAEGDLVLCQTEDEWVLDIRRYSSLEPEPIRAFVRFLTFGSGVRSPDQALQYFVPLGGKLLGVPGLALMSSNVDRNLLTLQARVDPRGFDSQSGMFEVEMTRHIEAACRAKWERVIPNRTYALGSVSEELDLLICEPQTKTLLLLELRWILSPADPREVQSKKDACQEKVPQAARKLAAVRANLGDLLQAAFALSLGAGESWRAEAAVVIEGFGGAPSPDPSIPIVPNWVLEAGISRARSLQVLVEWLVSADWLPQAGRDYTFSDEPRDLLGLQVGYAAVSPTRFGPQFLADATAALDVGD